MGMTNRDWLFSLPLEEQYAWMNAERTESPTSDTMRHIGQVIENTIKRGVYGDTEPQDADSREKLEADVRKHYAYSTTTLMYPPSANKTTDMLRALPVDTVIGWLDRQAAITERELCRQCEWPSLAAQPDREAYDRIAELTAERDKLKELNEYHALQYELASEDCDRLQAQVDELTAERDKLKGQVFTLKCECEDLENELHELTAERDNLKANNQQLHTLAGEQAATIDWLTAERDNLKDDLIDERGKLNRKMNALREVTRDYRNERDHYREKFGKCIDYADAIHALMDDEGMA